MGPTERDTNSANNSASDVTPVIVSPDLVVTKDDGITSVDTGDSVVYTIAYQNVGDVHATGVVLTETLPAGSTFDAANSDAGWSETSPGSGVYEFSVGTLNVGTSASVAFAVSVNNVIGAGIDDLINYGVHR